MTTKNETCRRPSCGGRMKPGEAMLPLWMLPNGNEPRRDQCVTQNRATLGPVMKCEKCGYSRGHNPQKTMR